MCKLSNFNIVRLTHYGKLNREKILSPYRSKARRELHLQERTESSPMDMRLSMRQRNDGSSSIHPARIHEIMRLSTKGARRKDWPTEQNAWGVIENSGIQNMVKHETALCARQELCRARYSCLPSMDE